MATNQFGFVSEEVFKEKMDLMNTFLGQIASAQMSSADVTSWKGVQTLVRAGLADKVFAIGDQLTCTKGTTTLTWDIIGIDVDIPADSQFTHSMTLQLHDCMSATMQVDNTEALYYCETALAAGTYNFTLLSGYDTTYGGGKTFQFTLTKEVPAGGVIMFPWAWNTQVSTTKISTYKTRTDTTVIESVAVTEGSEGTSLGTADGNTTNMNHTHRIRYGSNNYKESAIRQFLNSDKAAGAFWTPQTNFDRPPSWNASTAGFMNDLDSDFLAVIGKTEKVVSRNTVTDGGGSDTVKDKFFLLSRREVYMGNEISTVIEGEPYPYYSKYSDLSAAGTGTDSNRVKYRNGNAQYWWLRTPYAGTGGSVRRVSSTGTLDNVSAGSSLGVAPACNII